MQASTKSALMMTVAALATSAGAVDFAPWYSGAASMVQGHNGFTATPLYTIGETLPNGYQSVGVPDGIGAYRRDRNTIRVLVNAEIAPTLGTPYNVDNGAGGTTTLTGARVSFFDIDRNSRGIVGGGIAYDKIFDRTGAVVANAAQVGGGFSRFCSAAAFEANAFGADTGIRDRIFFTGEETSNGTMYALDTATRQLHAVPAFGRAAWENATQVNTGTTSKVAFVLGDDTAGSAQLLYVGTKDAGPGASFLARNGLVGGKLYAWKAGAGDLTSTTFNGGAGDTRNGSWVELTVRNQALAGTPGYDAEGYADAATIQAQADTLGAFSFSRPEDVATNPSDGTLVGFASTGRDSFNGGADTWGTVYTQKLGFDADGNPVSGTVTIAYNGNADLTRAVRSPDNLDWSDATHLLVQEDRAADWDAATNPNKADGGILKVGLDGSVEVVARIERNLFPLGAVDAFAGVIGEWETSGILDVSGLFGLAQGRLFIGDVQAHGIDLGSADLVQGGQLFLLASNVPEPASWGLMIAGFTLVGAAMRRRKPSFIAA